MPQASDPFEAFRKAREREGIRASAQRDRRRFARAISSIIDTVHGVDDLSDPDGEPIETPSRRDLEAIIRRLHEASERATDAEKRAAANALLTGFLEVGRRLLDGPRAERFRDGQEYEVAFPELFEFMQNPDLSSLPLSRRLR